MQDIQFYKRDKQEFGFMSNFAKFPIKIGGETWKTNEHYFQAMKVDPNDLGLERHTLKVKSANTPAEAKKLGRKVPLRHNWEQEKDKVMLDACRAKFSQHDKIRAKLLATGDAELIEDSPTDAYWGTGTDKGGDGKNMLGKILEQVRQELRDEQQNN